MKKFGKVAASIALCSLASMAIAPTAGVSAHTLSSHQAALGSGHHVCHGCHAHRPGSSRRVHRIEIVINNSNTNTATATNTNNLTNTGTNTNANTNTQSISRGKVTPSGVTVGTPIPLGPQTLTPGQNPAMTLTATCPAGTTLIGGVVTGLTGPNSVIAPTVVVASPTTLSVSLENTGTTTLTATGLTVVPLCQAH